MSGPKVGETFHVEGYDVVATAVHDTGQAMVLTNNSSCYLMADSSQPDSGVATLRSVHRYSDSDSGSAYDAYDDALHGMVKRALQESESLQDAD